MYKVLQKSLKTRELYWVIDRCLGIHLGVADKLDLIKNLRQVDHSCWDDLENHAQNYLWIMGYCSAGLLTSMEKDRAHQDFCLNGWKESYNSTPQ